MCGIAGLIDHKNSTEENINILGKMLHTQHHRGPDATGMWNDNRVFLGHNRLSIIDLSEAANQPMHYKQFTLIFNGEVYNYVELKKQLQSLGHIFETSSDTEVILHAFEEWGFECTQHFMGMWAFVIWDSVKQELFASRDRFGIKPFHYIFEDNRFYFASEIKTIKHSPLFSNDININQAARGLQLGWLCYNDETYFSKVKSLPAGNNLVFSEKQFKIYRYWQLKTGMYSDLSFEQKRQKFYDMFAESVQLHMRSDVPVASCLSGGLDSSAIVSMVQKLNPDLKYKSYSIFFEGEGGVDERPFIKEVIKKYPSVEPHYYSTSDENVLEYFQNALYHLDVPAASSSCVSHFYLVKMIAADGIRVVLNGQGADEFLGGYMHSFYRLIAGMLHDNKLMQAIKTTRDVNGLLGNNGVKAVSHFGKSVLAATHTEQQMYSLEFSKYYPFMTTAQKNPPPFELRNPAGSHLDKFLVNLIQYTSLPSILHYEDRISMSYSIESRVPFLDHRLVEFCFSLQDNDKINQTETKFILREALKQILPASIYSRKDKKGFVSPGESKWLRGPLKSLLENEKKLPDFIDRKKASAIFQNYKNGDNSQASLVWRLAVLGEWAGKI